MKHKPLSGLAAKTSLSVLLLLLASPAFGDGLIANAVSDYGQKIVDLSYLMLWLCLFFFVLVVGVVGYSLWKFRAKGPGEEGEKIHGHTGLEIIWTVIPAGLMIFLGVISTVLVIEQLNPPDQGPNAKQTLLVKVTGYQFGWDFEYFLSSTNFADGDNVARVDNICGNPSVFVKIKSLGVKTVDEFTIPKDTDIRFLTTATDVIHSFWVPEFLIKRDMVPGLVADFWVHPTKTGDFTAKCAALCGVSHGTMVAKLHIVEPQEFKTWLAAQPGFTEPAN